MERIGQATLLTGPPGSGAEERAWDLAREILGPRLEHHPDFLSIEPERGAIKIEVIREVIRRLGMKPFQSEHSVTLIRQADRMTEGAANALLKTLEEPPPFARFLLVSAQPELLPATIRSRCRRLSFASPPLETIREGYRQLFEETGKSLLERLGQAGPLLPGGSNFSPPDPRSLTTGKARSFAAASRLAQEVAEEPDRISPILGLLQAWWHDLVVYDETGQKSSLLFPEAEPLLQAWLQRHKGERLFEDLDLLLESARALEGHVNKHLVLERLFLRMIP